MQLILVILLVLAALIYVLRSLYLKTGSKKSSASGCDGCDGCALKDATGNTCSTPPQRSSKKTG